MLVPMTTRANHEPSLPRKPHDLRSNVPIQRHGLGPVWIVGRGTPAMAALVPPIKATGRVPQWIRREVTPGAILPPLMWATGKVDRQPVGGLAKATLRPSARVLLFLTEIVLTRLLLLGMILLGVNAMWVLSANLRRHKILKYRNKPNWTITLGRIISLASRTIGTTGTCAY